MSEFVKLSREEWAAQEQAANAYFASLPQSVKDTVHKVYGDMMALGYNRTVIRNAIAADYLARTSAPAKTDPNAAVKAKYSPAHKAKATKTTENVAEAVGKVMTTDEKIASLDAKLNKLIETLSK